ncbi:PH domain-containing protein [Myxococcota bacterium]|nr:PH domain-containing protein [Myxococcota bacterium]
MASEREPPDADDERTEVLRGGLLAELEHERTEFLRENHLEGNGLLSLDTPTEERPRHAAGPHPDDETVMSPAAPRARPEDIEPTVAALSLDVLEAETEEEAAAAPAEPAEALATDTPWRGLHPASLLVNLIPRTFGILLGYWPLLLAWLFGRGVTAPRPEDALFLLFILVPGIASTVVHFFTLRYRVSGGRMEIRQGLLNRQARTLAPDRIQNVSLVRNLFHRASGLVEVRIETAGDSSTEGLLSALSIEDAEALLTALNAARGEAARATPAADAPTAAPILTLGAPELLAYGFTAGGLGLAILLMAVGSEVLTVARPDEVNDLARQVSPTRLAGLGVLAIAASWTFSALRALVRHHGFTLTREPTPKGPGLRAVEGLFTRREVKLSLDKVQLVSAMEPPLRRLMGFGTVSVETAGFTAGENGLPAAAELVVPMVEQERMGELFAEAVPSLDLDPWSAPFNPAHPRALRRATVGTALFALPVGLTIGIALGQGAVWAAVVTLSFLALMLVRAVARHRSLGWRVTPDVILLRGGVLRRNTTLLARKKLQSTHLTQGPLDRMHGLAHLTVTVAGSSVRLPPLSVDEAQALQEELLSGG